MANVKIALVGGGSCTWGPTVVGNILANEYLSGCQVVLHDLDAAALDLVHGVALKLRDQMGADAHIDRTLDQQAALADADYVVVTISTGGLEAMRSDLEIPEKYGIYQTVGDTVGPGGLVRALRNVPVFLQLARAMERHCPQAWMLNCSNPLSALTRVVGKETPVRALGLCHGVRGVAGQFARFLGAELRDVAYTNTGIDHCAWFTDLVVGGRSARDLLEERGLEEWLAREPAQAEKDPEFGELYPQRCGLMLGRQVGALPAIGDRHMVEFLPGFLEGEENVAAYGLVRTSVQERQERRQKASQKLERQRRGDEAVESTRASDDVAGWIAALSGGPPIEDNLNAPNQGQIPQLPLGAVVETRGVLDATGYHPLASPMPAAVAALVAPHVTRQELTVEAAVEGCVDKALAVLTSDPLGGRPENTRAMLGEMMGATRAWLPQFER